MTMRASEQSLMRSVQALAQPADVQRALFPDFVCVGDELANDFDSARRAFLAETLPLARPQREALDSLDRYLDALSGEHNAEFWLDADQLSLDPRWEVIRAKARLTLVAFGWQDEPPPQDGAIYVNGRQLVHNKKRS
ncbi:hypothetical protein WME79_42415 [Sorangium sp. So ce726]|uniref:hypothetical protein n=1 Tax=Sorangium sp. So ce726 TaxID=3133319 RepID=UPI003F63F11B